MMKVVVKLDINDDKTKQKALKAVSSLLGIASISMDMKEKKLTVIGNIDPVNVIGKVRKIWPSAELVSVGQEKEEKKKEEPKKEESKPKAKNIQNDNEFMASYKSINSYPTTYYYYHSQQEENPNACVIS